MANTETRNVYYWDEIPMSKIVATERELEKRLRDEELKLATKCSPCAAFIVVKLKKTGQSFVVARDRRWNSQKGEYEITYQVLSDDCRHVVESYRVSEKSDAPLFTVAVRLIRLNRAWKYFDE